MDKGVCFAIEAEPCQEVYQSLLVAGANICTVASLIVRRQVRLNAHGMMVLEELEPFLSSKKETSEWPGTTLIGHVAELYEYGIVPGFTEILAEASNRLYAWQAPELPEDLCLYRASGAVWLASIAHERDAYLVLGDDEVQQLRKVIPSLRLAKDCDVNLSRRTP